MKWAIAIIIIAFFFASTSCRRHEQPTPINAADTTIVIDTSDSKYDTAWLYLYTRINDARINIGGINGGIDADALINFGNLDTTGTVVKHRQLNNDGIDAYYLTPYYYQYYHNWYSLTHGDCSQYRAGTWKIISDNGVTDMTYKMQSMSDFTEAIPQNISLSNGFNLSFDPMKYQSADSISIKIDDAQTHSITVSSKVQSGIAITAAQMSTLTWMGSGGAMEVTLIKHTIYKEHGRTFLISVYDKYEYTVTLNQ